MEPFLPAMNPPDIRKILSEINTLIQSVQDPIQKGFLEIPFSVATLLIQKNQDYGNSALSPLRIFSKVNRVEQLKVRIDDKLSRIRNDCGKSFKEDTILDLMGYLVLLKLALRDS